MTRAAAAAMAQLLRAGQNPQAGRAALRPTRRAGRREITAGANSGVEGQARAGPSSASLCSRSGTGGLLWESLTKPGQRPRQSRFDCAFRDTERGRGLLAAEIEQVAARDHEAVVHVQPVELAHEPPPGLG